MPDYLDKVWAKVNVTSPTECWPWTGALKKGYGYVIKPDGKGGQIFTGAYKVIHEDLNGPIPEGVELDHTCNNRVCCNPLHLEEVSHSENMKRLWRRGRGMTVSSSGHTHGRSRFTPAQISYIKTSGKSGRALARELGCNKTQIYRVRSGETYTTSEKKNHFHPARS